jgi:hypothetical protein
MKSLIKKILKEDRSEKLTDLIVNKVFTKMVPTPRTSEYSSTMDLFDDFEGTLHYYVDNNWNKFFEKIDDEDADGDDDYLYINKETGNQYDYQDMVTEMEYNWLDEMIKEGFITKEGDGDIFGDNIYTMYDTRIDFLYNNLRFSIFLNRIGNKIQTAIGAPETFLANLEKVLDDYGIEDKNEISLIKTKLYQKMVEKIEDIINDEKYGVLKIKE